MLKKRSIFAIACLYAADDSVHKNFVCIFGNILKKNSNAVKTLEAKGRIPSVVPLKLTKKSVRLKSEITLGMRLCLRSFTKSLGQSG